MRQILALLVLGTSLALSASVSWAEDTFGYGDRQRQPAPVVTTGPVTTEVVPSGPSAAQFSLLRMRDENRDTRR